MLEAADGFFSLRDLVVPDQVPWRLGSEPDGWDEDEWPEPLDGKRNSVAPLIDSADQAAKNAGGDELAPE